MRIAAPLRFDDVASPLPPPPQTTAEIGLGLAAFGLLFTVLGVMLFFDRGLLAMGNVSFRERHVVM